MQDINYETALRIAEAFLAESRHDFVIITQNTKEYEFGWVFRYTTRLYVQTGDRKYLAPGNGPLVVNRLGEVVELSTFRPEEEIKKYCETWKTAKHRP